MVKHTKIILPAMFLAGFCFLCSCTVDLLGLFGSNDLDTRLEEKNSFKFLTDAELNPPSFGDEYSFIVVTDTHIEDDDAYSLYNLKSVIDAGSGGEEIKFVVFTGDITQNGSRKDIERFKNIASHLGIPCYPVIGNHDVYFSNWPLWRELIGSTRYRIDDGDGTTLFILDSANAFFGKSQLDWLQRELKNAQGRVFVFTHTNLFVESPGDIQQLTDTKERARLVSLLRNRCDAMFTGHLHKRIETKIEGIPFVSIEDYKSKNIYCRVYVTGTGITYKFEKL